jgi:hypothetical protein
LKKLATDPAYTYDNTVMTADVEALFSGAYGKSLKPYFHLFLYTTQKLEIGVKQKSDTSYELKLLNLDMEIPLEIETEKGRQTIRVSKDAVTIQASGALRVDPQGFYMKKVIFE